MSYVATTVFAELAVATATRAVFEFSAFVFSRIEFCREGLALLVPVCVSWQGAVIYLFDV